MPYFEGAQFKEASDFVEEAANQLNSIGPGKSIWQNRRKVSQAAIYLQKAAIDLQKLLNLLEPPTTE